MTADVPSADPFERIVAALHEAAFDDGAWLRATALIDDACGMGGSQLCVVDARGEEPEYRFGWFHRHGRALAELEQAYIGHFPQDERIRRLLSMPAGTLLANADLLDEREIASSPLHRDLLPRWDAANQLVARLDGAAGEHVFWLPTRTSGQGEWRPTHLRTLRGLLPHVAHAVRCGQALRQAAAKGQAFAALLDDAQVGSVFLDRNGTVVEANSQARRHLDRDVLAALGDVLDAGGGTAVVAGRTSRLKVHVRRIETARFAAEATVAALIVEVP